MKIVNTFLVAAALGATALAATSVQAGGTTDTFVVNSTADTQTAGTLRQAIVDANNSVANQVNIDIDLPDDSEILLTADLPTLSHPTVQIRNIHPSRQITVDGDQSYHILRQIGSGTSLSVSAMQLREGWMDGSGGNDGGACLFTQGRALLYGVRFTDCETLNGSGAAVHARENLLVEDSRFDGNTVVQDGGTPVSRGGAIYCTGVFCAISGSSFSDNRVVIQLIGQLERGGGAAYLSAEEITVENSTFHRNRGLGRGGALNIRPTQADSFIRITASLFRANEGGEGGSLYVSGSNTGQSLTLERNSFERNTVTLRGAAIVATTVPQVTLKNNVFYMHDSSNTSVAWGAVYVFGNSTRSSTVSVDFNTFVGEDEDSVLFEASEGGSANDVVITRMHANVFDQRAARPACREDFSQLAPQSGQFNVVSDDSCTGTIESGSLVNVDPLLNEAISRPDRTLVYPEEASPAIDFVTSESLVLCSGQTDLDGIVRPLDGDDDGVAHCDAGALERNVTLFEDRFQT